MFYFFSPIMFVVISQSSSCGSAFQLGGWDVTYFHSGTSPYPLEVFGPIAQLVERLVKLLVSNERKFQFKSASCFATDCTLRSCFFKNIHE